MKTKQSHTPGPWYIRKTVADAFSDSSSWYGVGPKIDGAIWFVANQCNEDDARLIAAAPDLLEAAIEAEVNSRRRLPIKKSTWLKLRMAIEKAETGKLNQGGE